jgi:hypothetical protein
MAPAALVSISGWSIFERICASSTDDASTESNLIVGLIIIMLSMRLVQALEYLT